MKKKLTLRNATLEDAELLFDWQIHPLTRRYFINPKKPLWHEHLNWLRKVIDTDDSILLIASDDCKSIGVLRFDINGLQADVSIYLSPDEHGKGYGTKLLGQGVEWFCKNYPDIDFLNAIIRPENTASQCIFHKNKFKKISERYQLNLNELT